jgi:4'-phosphopantetheinyl transferase
LTAALLDTWRESSIPPRLEPGEVSVWRIDVRECEDAEWLASSLVADERARAERFRHRMAREHFVAGRGALRQLLGALLHMEPSRVPLVAAASGKLSCPGGPGFSVAHSGGLVLVALAMGAEVGVDVERIEARTNLAQVVSRMFTEREAAALARARTGEGEAAERLAFFQLWTLKEAVLKADGRGLSLAMSSFEVIGDVALVGSRKFFAVGVPLTEGFAAAVATSVRSRLHLLRFPCNGCGSA